MRVPLLSIAASVLVAGAPEEIVYAPAEGAELVRTFDSRASYALDSLAIEIDGEEIPHGDAPELEIESSEHIVVTDTLVDVEGGRPTRLKRRFDELGRDVRYSAPGEDDLERESRCDLEGATVVFQWKEDDEVYEASADEGESLPEETLDDLIEDMDLRQLLPGREVEPGEEWEVEVDAYARLMWPGGFLHFYEEDAEVDPDDVAGDRELVDNLEGTAKVRLDGLGDEDGVRVARLHVTIEARSSATRQVEGPGGQEAERETTLERTIEGTVLWAVEEGRLHAAELHADATLEVSETATMHGPDGEEAELRQTRSFAGTIEYTLAVEARG